MRKFFWSRETETEAALMARLGGSASLSERMAAGPLPLAEALRYAIATAEALREVHARGRVYSLLQPAGVSIRNNQLQLVPVVISAITPYTSPEQLMGRDLDLRSDIFSLGAILYEMLSGRKAFPAPSRPALRFAILDAEPEPLKNVPPAIAQLVMRCLEKKPERRVQRMEILLAQLKLHEIVAASNQGASVG
jgi:eukaryotic-like serine/threonine-protein kinase